MVGEQSCEMMEPIKLSMCNYFPKRSFCESKTLSSYGYQKTRPYYKDHSVSIFKIFIHILLKLHSCMSTEVSLVANVEQVVPYYATKF